jgi:hypothetical protein
MIPVAISSFDRLYLTQAETDRLIDQISQELVCRTADQTEEPVVVADIPLSPAQAWQLLVKLEDSLEEGEIDWLVEGF